MTIDTNSLKLNEKNKEKNSNNSHRRVRSINNSHRNEKEISVILPMNVKQEFVNLVSKLHNGHASNYQNLEFNEAVKLHIESWMNMEEKPKTGIFSLPSQTCPKPNMIAKLTYLSEIAKIQPPFPKFTMKGLLYVSEITFGTDSALKTKKKFADLLKTLSDVDMNEQTGIEREYDLTLFCKFIDRLKHIKSQKEKDILWSNHIGYKFNIKKNMIIPEFEKNIKTSTMHVRVDKFRKDQFDAILIEKYSGKKRKTQSFEYATAISNYIYFMNKEKQTDYTETVWNEKRL